MATHIGFHNLVFFKVTTASLEGSELISAELSCARNTNLLLLLQYASKLCKHKINNVNIIIVLVCLGFFPYINLLH